MGQGEADGTERPPVVGTEARPPGVIPGERTDGLSARNPTLSRYSWLEGRHKGEEMGTDSITLWRPEGKLRNQLSAKATNVEKKCFIACYFFFQNLTIEGS